MVFILRNVLQCFIHDPQSKMFYSAPFMVLSLRNVLQCFIHDPQSRMCYSAPFIHSLTHFTVIHSSVHSFYSDSFIHSSFYGRFCINLHNLKIFFTLPRVFFPLYQVLEAQRREKEAREEILTLKAELRALSENSTRLQQHLKGQMDTQTRFSIVS